MIKLEMNVEQHWKTPMQSRKFQESRRVSAEKVFQRFPRGVRCHFENIKKSKTQISTFPVRFYSQGNKKRQPDKFLDSTFAGNFEGSLNFRKESDYSVSGFPPKKRVNFIERIVYIKVVLGQPTTESKMKHPQQSVDDSTRRNIVRNEKDGFYHV